MGGGAFAEGKVKGRRWKRGGISGSYTFFLSCWLASYLLTFSFVIEVWYLVFNVWCLGLGLSCLVLGALFFVRLVCLF